MAKRHCSVLYGEVEEREGKILHEKLFNFVILSAFPDPLCLSFATRPVGLAASQPS